MLPEPSPMFFDPMFPLMDCFSHGLLSMVLIMAQSLHHDGVIAQSACGYAPPSLMYINTQVDAPAPQFGLLVTGTGKPLWLYVDRCNTNLVTGTDIILSVTAKL